MKKAYVIRTQGCGIHHEKVFLQPPTQLDLDAAIALELERHGLGKDGAPRERWAQVQEVELCDGAASGVKPGERSKSKLSEEAAALLKAPQASQGAASTGEMSVTGEGTVTNPA